jgi:isoamylase
MDVATFEGQAISDDTFYLCFNAYHEKLPFIMPGKDDVSWQLILNTAEPEGFIEDGVIMAAGTEFTMEGRSFCLFKQTHGSDEEVKAGAKDKARQVAEDKAKKAAEEKQAQEAAAPEQPSTEPADPATIKEPKKRAKKSRQ